jgi:hypothetical protein
MKRCAVIVLFAVIFSPLLAAAQPLADRIPDDAIFYFGWRGADAPGSGYSESRLKAFLDASALPQLINDALPKVLDKLGEKDRGAAIFRELLGKLGPAYWHHPVAFYIGPVDGLNVGQPMPRIALLCQAGAGAAQLKKDLNAQLDQLLVNSLVPVTAIEEDGIVAITLGNVTPDLAAKSKTTLPYRKEFTDAMAQVGKDPLLVAYADIESLTALIDHAITNVPQAAEKWRAIRDTLGLGGLKRVAWTAGFDGRDFATNGLILAPAPRTGLLQLLDSGPITDEALHAVPKSATMLLAGKIDFVKLLSMLRTIGGKFDPAAPDRINSGLEIANVVVGLNIEKDLIEPFGDEWLAYTAPTIGGVGPLGLVVVNRAHDAAKLEQSLGAVERLINDKINSDTPTGAPRGNFAQAKIDGLNVHYFNTPFVSPAWTIKNGNLYVALYPQTAAAAANATGGSILDNEDYRGSLKRLGAVKPSQITYFDLPKSAPVGYPYMLALTRVLGFADMFGMQTPPAVLPSIDKLMPLLSPAASAAWTDDTGMHTRSITPFPGATLLGGPEVILAEGGGLIVPAIAGAREKARKESLGAK